ncbi:hypothetical protein [Qipengyuania flava]|jgi:hypothetical protein|uniref:hypothetical protein n=1 Tax=Qipengyuania flava TaxID=192812 RepID=UPI00321AA914
MKFGKTIREMTMDDRKTFLVEIYKQMFSDINRHLTVIWQSVSVLVGAFALLALSERNVVPADVAISLIILLCGWLYAHMLDAGYWYNRNLVIIANIERQFLVKSDLSEIHFYWGEHRSNKNKMITHIRIQAALGCALGTLVIAFHFSTRVFPGIIAENALFEPLRALPYVSAIGVIIYCAWLSNDRNNAYTNFRKNSPGIDVDTTGVEYGTGHTIDDLPK